MSCTQFINFLLRIYSFVRAPLTSSTTVFPFSRYTKSAMYVTDLSLPHFGINSYLTCLCRFDIYPARSNSFNSMYLLASLTESNSMPLITVLRFLYLLISHPAIDSFYSCPLIPLKYVFRTFLSAVKR